MKKRKVKTVLASFTVVLALAGVFYASANTPPPRGNMCVQRKLLHQVLL